MVAVLLLLMALILPSFLGSRGKAQDRAAQSSITVAYHDAKVSLTDQGAYPALVGADGLLSQLVASEPGITFVNGDDLVGDEFPADAGSRDVAVWLEGSGEQTLTLCAPSDSGRIYCLRADENGDLIAAAAPAGEPGFTPAAGGATISRSTGSGEQGLQVARCYLANFPGEPNDDCASLAGEGAPAWTSSLAASPRSGGGEEGEGSTTAPELALLAGPSTSNATTATVAWSLTGNATLTCQLDGQTFTPCVNPVALSGLSTGPHTFTVTATNAGGSDDLTVSWSVLVADPTLTWTSAPADSTSTAATLAYSSGGGAATVTCALDGQALADPQTNCASPVAFTGLGAGSHTFTVHAENVSGSADLTHTWQVLVAAPTLAWTSTPSDSLAQTAALSYSQGGGAAALTCALDGQALANPQTNCVSPISLTGLGYGQHTFTIHASNAGGSADLTHSWQVETPGPELAWVTTPSNSQSTAAAFAYSVVGPNPTITCALDGQALSNPQTACVSPVSFTGLGDGSHTFTVHASNAGGSADLTHTWTVIVASPTLSWTSQPSNSTATTATAAYSATGSSTTITCALDAQAISPSSLCASPISLTGLSYGSHTLTVHSQNAGGSADLTSTWTVQRPAPTVTLTSQPSNSTATSGSVAYTTTGPDVTVTCAIDGAAQGSCASPISASGLSIGSHSISVTATNTGGTDTKTATWSVLAPAPTVTFTGGPAESASSSNTSETFTWSATNASSFTCALDGGTAASCSSGYSTGNLSDGSHTLVVTASGPGGSASATRHWIYTPTYAAAVLSDGPQAYYQLGETSGLPQDSSGHGYHLTQGAAGNGATGPMTGNKAFSFSGSQSVNTTSVATWAARSSGSALTAEAWINSNWSAGDGRRIIIGNSEYYGASNQDRRNWLLAIDANGFIQLASGGSTVTSTFKPTNGTWTHLAAVITSGGAASIYADGILVGSRGSFTYGNNGNFFGIGYDANSGAAGNLIPPFKGSIDEVAVYDTALSVTRIRKHYSYNPVAPTVVITNPPASNTTTSGSVSFSTSANATSVECKLDTADWGACSSFDTSSFTGTQTYSGLSQSADVDHTLQVRATGPYGTSSPVSATWTVYGTSSNYYKVTNTAGVVSYLPLNEAAGSTTVSDVYSGRTGTLGSGVTLGASGSAKTAASFNGTGAISLTGITSLPIGNASYTVEAWIKPTGYGAQGIVSWGSGVNTVGTNNAFRVTSASEATGTSPANVTGLVHYWYGGSANTWASATNLANGGWHHVASTYNGTSKKVYVDGTLVATNSSPGTASVGSSVFYIGQTPFNERFSGSIDEVAIYNTALSDATIAQHASN